MKGINSQNSQSSTHVTQLSEVFGGFAYHLRGDRDQYVNTARGGGGRGEQVVVS